ncbi:MarC family protein [Ferrimonas marina]|uniref:UPF0056 membrane protein n=1 Tax=Ferrimonas marina TaxID=299255 RepID=A0A1M5S8L5_9GAMM|nr:MarC family protein [Ferrimonas marina]SHH34821.1 multiple antibiotic resistance protein [Ferrimonas marina]
MGDLFNTMITVFLGFFAIMNPLANTAVFLGLTAEQAPQQRRQSAFRALLIAFCIVAVFALVGKALFHLFGITLPALRITGGILVFLIGFHMLQGQSSHLHKGEEPDNDIALSPLAVPILAGPGTLATAMSFSAQGGLGAVSVTIAMFALLCVISYACFMMGDRLVSFVGESGMTIITRLMGLILAVIGTQMALEGIAGAIAALPNAGG